MKGNRYLAAAAFFLGIVIANLWGEDLLANYGIVNTYCLKQYACADIEYHRLLYQIIWVRMWEIAAVLILGRIVSPKVLLFFLESILGISFGILMVSAITNLGVRGIVIVLGGVFPQWLFYLTSGGMFFYARMRRERYGRNDTPAEVAGYAAALLLFLIGILSEVYGNPVLWRQLLKNF